MKYPVYRFSDVLRALRNEADLTVLKTRELTDYTKYERWESGKTKVGPQYLEPIADVFGIEGDLWLLTYAWLVDRFTPLPGKCQVQFTHQGLSELLRKLPKGPVDLGDHQKLAVRPVSHGQLALGCLIARYGSVCVDAASPLVLEATSRTPAPTPDRSRYILGCYTDVLGDLGRYAARTFLVSGMGQARPGVAVAVSRQLLLYLAEPEALVSWLDSAAPTPGPRQRGLDGFSATAARSLPSFRRMADRQLEELRRLAAAAEGRDVTVEEVKAEIRALVRDDEYWESLAELDDLDAEELVAALKKVLEDEQWWLSAEDWPVTRVVPELPEPDPALVAEYQRMHDQLDRRCRRAIQEEVVDASATAEPAAALEAATILRRDRMAH